MLDEPGSRTGPLPVAYIRCDDDDGTTAGERLRFGLGRATGEIHWTGGVTMLTRRRSHRLLFLGAPFAAALLIPATALAATFTGTPGPDHIVGTASADVISGLGGNDVLEGRGGPDVISGGLGADAIAGGDGNDILYGGDGNDRISGGAGNDVIYGGSGNDILYGGDQADVIVGGAGHDFVYGGYGNDIIRVGGDRSSDAVHCGPGWDVAYLGRYDIADSSCERVVRTLEP
jgi:Ca2+-binding RTX toxin-like protein